MSREHSSYRYQLTPRGSVSKVTFPNLDHFLAEVADTAIDTVRADVFPMVTPSDLSFVYHITMTLYVTAVDPETALILEYAEPLATDVTTDLSVAPPLDAAVEARLSEVEESILTVAPIIRRGRYVVG